MYEFIFVVFAGFVSIVALLVAFGIGVAIVHSIFRAFGVID